MSVEPSGSVVCAERTLVQRIGERSFHPVLGYRESLVMGPVCDMGPPRFEHIQRLLQYVFHIVAIVTSWSVMCALTHIMADMPMVVK